MTGWNFHPRVRTGSELTRGERAADRMRNGMGSWGFVFGALVFLGVWMALNIVLAKRGGAFDAYPFILLNLVLSCVAALQGAILLIAAKRSDQVSSELAQHDYEADQRSKELLETLTVDFAKLTAQHAEQGKQLATLIAAVGLPAPAVGARGEVGPEPVVSAPDAVVQPAAPRVSRRRATGGGAP